ncbi:MULTISPECIES: hypothetical protein [Streptomycetaceae]|uniref:Uncharacterized protein n=1 Tax=Streptantibioticus cattleyicolor (strain ATCC 35852 / DSM 46488 / JCM 4925 / NBRC 14057 / NRRL 8057) TaxID=1003195 RepID=F8JZ38_STREN|nr:MULTISPECIES: hypothetical protein [Streptomycetaceae]AEW94705.1 hypothetical protein SCATT_23340 [Streptantibioticus cattleyicolor NRRL 8057 = DSM 46488]MYS59337.1 hypothetical protein [Streptomyces sp. SID5468]CCB75060.1 protein of unknown function [Streptantibioticus cattleyicolor NRRL 8057 = DSM 46488]
MTTNLPGPGIKRPDPGIGTATGTGDIKDIQAVLDEQEPLQVSDEGNPLPKGGKPIIKPDNWSNP